MLRTNKQDKIKQKSLRLSKFRNNLIKDYYDRRNEIKDKLTNAILNLREDGYFDYSGIEYDILEEDH